MNFSSICGAFIVLEDYTKGESYYYLLVALMEGNFSLGASWN